MGFSLGSLRAQVRGARTRNHRGGTLSRTVRSAVSKPKQGFPQWPFGAINRFLTVQKRRNTPMVAFSRQKAFAIRLQNPY
ncbi:hypothetical protein [Zhengella mangrovi]|uniref:hypothetical protein n=1 Tax=Zhengella mangrovi TaxID=1982044 RepID=UPI0013FE07C8|nr:hypothetical protein [Zhengella mangrovi]